MLRCFITYSSLLVIFLHRLLLIKSKMLSFRNCCFLFLMAHLVPCFLLVALMTTIKWRKLRWRLFPVIWKITIFVRWFDVRELVETLSDWLRSFFLNLVVFFENEIWYKSDFQIFLGYRFNLTKNGSYLMKFGLYDCYINFF